LAVPLGISPLPVTVTSTASPGATVVGLTVSVGAAAAKGAWTDATPRIAHTTSLVLIL
jgi:hypothetical protein